MSRAALLREAIRTSRGQELLRQYVQWRNMIIPRSWRIVLGIAGAATVFGLILIDAFDRPPMRGTLLVSLLVAYELINQITFQISRKNERAALRSRFALFGAALVLFGVVGYFTRGDAFNTQFFGSPKFLVGAIGVSVLVGVMMSEFCVNIGSRFLIPRALGPRTQELLVSDGEGESVGRA